MQRKCDCQTNYLHHFFHIIIVQSEKLISHLFAATFHFQIPSKRKCYHRTRIYFERKTLFTNIQTNVNESIMSRALLRKPPCKLGSCVCMSKGANVCVQFTCGSQVLKPSVNLSFSMSFWSIKFDLNLKTEFVRWTKNALAVKNGTHE